MAHDYDSKSRLIARILRDFLRTATFENLADLTDAFKARLVTLNIKATPEDITQAYAMLGSNMNIAAPPAGLEPVREWHEQLPDTPTLNKSEAASVYRQLLARYRAETPATPMLGAPEHFPTLVRVR